MRKLSFLLVFFAVTMFAQAQIATNIYWVQFTDKENSPYSIDNPEAYLSPRALQRRANLGIGIDEYEAQDAVDNQRDAKAGQRGGHHGSYVIVQRCLSSSCCNVCRVAER